MIRARGFSMVELMVAITLALIVTTGVISIFIGSRSAYNATSGTAQLTDGGRFALNFISTSVRGAGNMACTTAPLVQGILSAGATALTTSWTQALGGFEAVGGGTPYTIATAPVTPDSSNADWVGGLDAALTNLVIRNNDVLVVRSTLANAVPAYVQTITDGASSFTVYQPAAAPPPLANNQIAVISDCSKGVIFQITGVSSGANPTITHNGGGGPPGNTGSAFPASLSFPPGSQVTPVDTLAYYIGKGLDGDGALFVYSSNAKGNWQSTELVPDIEAMQILYGLDTNNSQTVSNYVTANQVLDFNTVMSVKVAILAASAPGVGRAPAAVSYDLLGTTVTPPADSRSRQVFEATIAVRNSLH